MWFKSASLFVLDGFKHDQESLDALLQDKAFTPCNKRQLNSYGWVAPMAEGEQLAYPSSDMLLLKARFEERVLPPAVIAEHMAQKIAALEQKLDRKIRGREKLDIRDNIVIELTAQAFTKSSYAHLLIIPSKRLLVVDQTSAKRVDQCTSLLRDSIGSLSIKPVRTAVDPTRLFTRWIKGTRKTPDDVTVGTNCVIQSEDSASAVVRCKNRDLFSDEIRALAGASEQVTQLAMEAETISFTLSDEFIFSQIKSLNTDTSPAYTEDDQADIEPASARFDASVAFMALELSQLFTHVIEVFGGLEDD